MKDSELRTRAKALALHIIAVCDALILVKVEVY